MQVVFKDKKYILVYLFLKITFITLINNKIKCK